MLFKKNQKKIRRQRRNRIICMYEAILDAMNKNYKYGVYELSFGPARCNNSEEKRCTEYAAIRLLRAKYPVLRVGIKYKTVGMPEWATVAEMGDSSINYKSVIEW